jgi:hypothetical protein
LWYMSFSQGLWLMGGLMVVMVGMYVIVWKKAPTVDSKSSNH